MLRPVLLNSLILFFLMFLLKAFGQPLSEDEESPVGTINFDIRDGVNQISGQNVDITVLEGDINSLSLPDGTLLVTPYEGVSYEFGVKVSNAEILTLGDPDDGLAVVLDVLRNKERQIVFNPSKGESSLKSPEGCIKPGSYKIVPTAQVDQQRPCPTEDHIGPEGLTFFSAHLGRGSSEGVNDTPLSGAGSSGFDNGDDDTLSRGHYGKGFTIPGDELGLPLFNRMDSLNDIVTTMLTPVSKGKMLDQFMPQEGGLAQPETTAIYVLYTEYSLYSSHDHERVKLLSFVENVLGSLKDEELRMLHMFLTTEDMPMQDFKATYTDSGRGERYSTNTLFGRWLNCKGLHLKERIETWLKCRDINLVDNASSQQRTGWVDQQFYFSRQNIGELHKLLSGHDYKWNGIAGCLGLQYGEIQAILKDNPIGTVSEHLLTTLNRWVENKAGNKKPPTLEVICKALRSSVVGLGAVANSVEASFSFRKKASVGASH